MTYIYLIYATDTSTDVTSYHSMWDDPLKALIVSDAHESAGEFACEIFGCQLNGYERFVVKQKGGYNAAT